MVHKKEVNEQRKGYYSTSLINLCQKEIRVKKFAGYSQHYGMYVLSTITGGYFTAQNFREWYGLDEDGWIKPGQIVTDQNNYSASKCYWVYFCLTESGKEFVAGAEFQEINPWWKFW